MWSELQESNTLPFNITSLHFIKSPRHSFVGLAYKFKKEMVRGNPTAKYFQSITLIDSTRNYMKQSHESLLTV